ncbi:MAG TPA: hypothetical protein VN893_10965 [Bryobacteraceae bacterium]|jgi:hypothetical protein|nr:hypothetical protein [Bryobacteraceae bacterium]
MISLLAELLFRCAHRRLTRPITPVSKPGVPSGETYVVCLECGKQFYYDWEKMRLGGPVERSEAKGVIPLDSPRPSRTKLKYALLGSAIPLAVLLGKTLLTKPKKKDPPARGGSGSTEPRA